MKSNNPYASQMLPPMLLPIEDRSVYHQGWEKGMEDAKRTVEWRNAWGNLLSGIANAIFFTLVGIAVAKMLIVQVGDAGKKIGIEQERACWVQTGKGCPQ